MQFKRTLLIAAVALTASAGLASAASADTPWQNHHPRQEQVLERARFQKHDIRSEFNEGTLTRAQEHRLLAADNRIIREDRFFSHVNGGYITRREQRFMNRQEGRVHYHLPK